MNRIIKSIKGLLGREIRQPSAAAQGANPCPDTAAAGMPSCQEINQFLTEYLDGDMDPETRQRFENHVSQCAPCHGYFDQYRQTVDLTHTCRDSELPPDLVEHTLEFLRQHRTP